ncbi:MAG TPA: thioredoxin domain-containing protein [Baekduia sp.]|nr:thioredoxin domain-containing protein [Baekduia sp.]
MGAEPTEAQRRRLWQIGAAFVAFVVVAIAVALIAGAGGSDERRGPLEEVADVRAQFGGVPQDGIALGSPRAPVTLTEFADLQCPFCRRFAEDALPELIERYVRPGRLRIVFRSLAFLGDDSEEAARAAAAAGLQDRLWPFVDLVFRNQGFENTGWVDEAFLRRVARGAGGIDVARLLRDRAAPAVERQLREAKDEAERFDISSTPSFLLGPTGGRQRRLDVDDLDAGAFRGPVEDALAGR